jgi:hypothetical protein
MVHHEDLAEADGLIADCMARIARQRGVSQPGMKKVPHGCSRVDAAGIGGKPARLGEASAISLIGSKTRSRHDGETAPDAREAAMAALAKSWRRE